MNKKLAIKGHPTRGKEVIELLEMMGGSNPFSDGMVIGNKVTNYYYISEDTATKYISWDYIGPDEINEYKIFTLEEFLEKYPFKVGDKVIDDSGESGVIIEMKWDEEIIYKVDFGKECYYFTSDFLRPYKEVIDTQPSKIKNVLVELLEHIKTTPKEELEREFEEIKEWSNVGPTVEEFMTFCESVNKKPVYPKTYDECCDVLKIPNDERYIDIDVPLDYNKLVSTFTELIICRKAYWKIAGEELGLGKPWKPDWTDDDEDIFCIYNVNGTIYSDGGYPSNNKILVFPTEEMRDTFYANFKDLIEDCKELL